jgi:ubiquinone/menaquinone biosynthesis C-methylase UbiE
MDKEISSSKIKDGGCDIYYVDDFSIILPQTVLLNDKTYFRFCDFILIPDSTESLSQEQVSIVNQIRSDYFGTHPQFHTNNTVREKFQSMIDLLNPTTIFEFGPGSNPFTLANDNDKQFYYADFSSTTVDVLKSLGLNCTLFGKESMLNLPNGFVDVIISIFVFQFDVSQTQVNELYRVLKRNGFLLANMYRRSVEARNKLLERFTSAGFSHCIVSDKSNICHNHEYWILYKTKNEEQVIELIERINRRNN